MNNLNANETTNFEYEDESQDLADMMLDLLKCSSASKDEPAVYNLNEMDITNSGDDSHFKRQTFVEIKVVDCFHKKTNDKVVSYEDFWFDKAGNGLPSVGWAKAPHWNRKSVTVRVYNKLENGSDTEYNLLELGTWFAAKNKSFSDLCMGTMFFEPTKLRAGVNAEWADIVCSKTGDDEYVVPEDMFRGVIGSLISLRTKLVKDNDNKMKDLYKMFA